MKIGYDAKRAFKNRTGLGNYSRDLINIVAKYFPYQTIVLYTPTYKAPPELSFLNHPNINICKPTGLWATFNSFWRSFKIAKQAQADGIDIYHGLSHELPQGIHKTGIKTVVTMHDLIVLRYPHLYSAIDRFFYMRKYKYACKVADLIVAISEQTKRDLVELMGVEESKIRTVYQVCHPIFRTVPNAETQQQVKQRYGLPNKYILNVGTIERRKNLITIIRSLQALPSDVHLVAVGKPSAEYMKDLKTEIDKLALNSRVHFLHNVSFADLPSVYTLSSVFVYPSVFEGFGIPILEAMSIGVPVVAANTSSLPEVGGNAAKYINPDDYESLSSIVKNIFQDNSLRQSMIEKGKDQAGIFTEENIAKAIGAVYEELI